MIVIIGGGICGLSIGWYLAQAGQPVTILERGEAGRRATWAAAGMLCPWYVPNSTHKALFQLQRASHELWPDFARNLQTATNINIGNRAKVTL